MTAAAAAAAATTQPGANRVALATEIAPRTKQGDQMGPIRALAGAALLALGLLAGCSEGGGGQDGRGAAALQISDFAFSPDRLTVDAGDEVTVRNDDGTTHTVTAEGDGFNVEVGSGDTATFGAPEDPGEYAFHCTIHPQMQATLVVR